VPYAAATAIMAIAETTILKLNMVFDRNYYRSIKSEYSTA